MDTIIIYCIYIYIYIYIYISTKFTSLKYQHFICALKQYLSTFCIISSMNHSVPKTGFILFMLNYVAHHIHLRGALSSGPVSGSGGSDSPHSGPFSLAGLCGDQGSLAQHDGKVSEDSSSAERPAVPLHAVDRARRGKRPSVNILYPSHALLDI